jgi:hypothetical protein
MYTIQIPGTDQFGDRESELGLYDTMSPLRYGITIEDRPGMITNRLIDRTKWEVDGGNGDAFEVEYFKLVPCTFDSDTAALNWRGGESGFNIGMRKEKMEHIRLDWKDIISLTATPNTFTHDAGDVEFDIKLTAELNSLSPTAVQIQEWVQRVNRPSYGSMRMVDECKFFLNGTDLDPTGHTAAWYPGEPDVGRYVHHHDFNISTYNGSENIITPEVDREGWKLYREPVRP